MAAEGGGHARQAVTIGSRRDIIDFVNSHPTGSRRGKIMVFIALGGIFIDAYDFTSLGIGVESLQQQLGLTPFQLGSVTASMAFGALAGALVGGYLVDRLGRFKLFIVDLMLFVVAAIGAALAPNLTWLLIFRFLLGVGVGVDMPASFSFVAEFISTKAKGKYVNLWQLMWYLAVVSTVLVALPFYFAGVEENLWRWAVGFGAVPAAIVLVLRLVYADESPMWAAHHLGLRTAARILEKNYDVRVVVAGEERPVAGEHARFTAVFQRGFRARTALISVVSGTQAMEYYAVGFYVPVITSLILGKGVLFALLGTLVINLFGILGGGTQPFLTQRLGVWWLAVIGYSIVITCLVAAGLTEGKVSIYLSALLIGLFIFGHSFGPGSQGKTMAALSYPTEFRGVGMGWAESMSRVGTISGFYVFPLVLAAVGLGGTLLILTVIPLVGLAGLLAIRWEPVGKDVETPEGRTAFPVVEHP
ncbi:MAG: MFS transporter [Carbonactinosporaceae bacterium]